MKRCLICKRKFISLSIHHINGNHEDNRKENRIPICRGCHVIIHCGLKSENNVYRRFTETFGKLKIYRDFYLLSKYPNKITNRKQDILCLSNEVKFI